MLMRGQGARGGARSGIFPDPNYRVEEPRLGDGAALSYWRCPGLQSRMRVGYAPDCFEIAFFYKADGGRADAPQVSSAVPIGNRKYGLES